jgi:N-acetylneuraminic acid mutarotase
MKTVKTLWVRLIMIGGLLYAGSACFAQSPWTQKADMLSPRKGHSSCILDGKIVVLGGKNSEGITLSSMEVYDPVLNSWTPKPDMAEIRINFPAFVFNGKILAAGGSQASKSDPITAIEEYDPVSDTWTHKADLPRARLGLTAAIVDGQMYIIGGFREPGLWIPIPEVDVYDLQTGEWTTAADLKTPRWWSSSVVINNQIYVMGGENVKPYNGLHTVEAYDPATDTWATKADMITNRKMLGVCILNSMIYVFGGSSGNCSGPVSSVEAYDPATDTWTECTPMPEGMATGGLSVTVLDRKAYISGGVFTPCEPSTITATMYEYDPALDPMGTEVIADHIQQLPGEFLLNQNYPNPFNPSTTIRFDLPEPGEVTLKVFTLLGEEVETLISRRMHAGQHQVLWNGGNHSAGIYLIRLEAGGFVQSRKMIVMK